MQGPGSPQLHPGWLGGLEERQEGSEAPGGGGQRMEDTMRLTHLGYAGEYTIIVFSPVGDHLFLGWAPSHDREML